MNIFTTLKDSALQSVRLAGSCSVTDVLPMITSFQDLFDNSDKLECYFAQECRDWVFRPGNHEGVLLSAINQPILNEVINKYYRGEFTFPLDCTEIEDEGWIGSTNLFNTGMLATGHFTQTDQLEINLTDGQAPLINGSKYLSMDYTINPDDLCPSSAGPSLVPIFPSLPPAAAYYDIGIPVGVDNDGSLIILAKAFGYGSGGSIYDAPSATMEREWSNVLFYAFKVRQEIEDIYDCSWGNPAANIDYDYNPFFSIWQSGISSFPRVAALRGNQLASWVQAGDFKSKADGFKTNLSNYIQTLF